MICLPVKLHNTSLPSPIHPTARTHPSPALGSLSGSLQWGALQRQPHTSCPANASIVHTQPARCKHVSIQRSQQQLCTTCGVIQQATRLQARACCTRSLYKAASSSRLACRAWPSALAWLARPFQRWISASRRLQHSTCSLPCIPEAASTWQTTLERQDLLYLSLA